MHLFLYLFRAYEPMLVDAYTKCTRIYFPTTCQGQNRLARHGRFLLVE